VPDCVATSMVANFAASAGAASGKGYQAPSTSNGSDTSVFPQWLCKTGLPSGLVTSSCQ
jgi:hypothetical protein